MDYSEESVAEASAAYRRVEGFLTRAAELTGEGPAGTVPAAFAAAMDDDLSVPQALAVVHDAVREGNAALAAGDKAAVAEQYGEVRAMLGVLGVDPLAAPWRDERRVDLASVVDALVGVALEQRQAGARPQGLRGRRRDPRPAVSRRHHRRGHPDRPALDAGLLDARNCLATPGCRRLGIRRVDPAPAPADSSGSAAAGRGLDGAGIHRNQVEDTP